MFDTTLLILLGLAALGFISHNTTVAISILVLIIVRVTPLNAFFPWVEKQGLTVGIIILTIGVMAPIASAAGDCGRGVCFVARRARRLPDGLPAASGGRAAGRYSTRRRPVSRRPGRAADCRRDHLIVYWEVVARLP